MTTTETPVSATTDDETLTNNVPTVTANQARLDRLLGNDWRLLIGGRLVPAASARVFPVVSPYTESVIAEAPNGDDTDVNTAVAAAASAATRWARTAASARADLILELAAAIDETAEDFAVLDAGDGGAPVSVMRRDVTMAVESLRYFAGLAREVKGYTVPASENLHFTERQPYGVVGKIIPFNHPFMFAASKIAAPLVAGNCVVLKPAELTPLSALLLGELAREILPPGVLSVVVGDGSQVPEAIVRHPDVLRIGFTGSETTGRHIQAAAAQVAVKHVTLELGGKNALIAFPDADPAEVAAGIVGGMNFTWSGQSCGSTSRLLVHEKIADEVLAHVQKLVEPRTYPSPLDPQAVQGTMVSRRQYLRVLDYLDNAVAQGARVITGGGHPSNADRGLFIAPTFLDGVDPSWQIAREEIFGPVVSVIRWSEESDAINIANSVSYGLTGSIYTNDVRTAHRAARELETGFVWINGAGQHFLGLPYGGWKNSGVGLEEGIEELQSYTRSKSITVMLP